MANSFNGQTLVLLSSIDNKLAVDRKNAKEGSIVRKESPSEDTR